MLTRIFKNSALSTRLLAGLCAVFCSGAVSLWPQALRAQESLDRSTASDAAEAETAETSTPETAAVDNSTPESELATEEPIDTPAHSESTSGSDQTSSPRDELTDTSEIEPTTETTTETESETDSTTEPIEPTPDPTTDPTPEPNTPNTASQNETPTETSPPENTDETAQPSSNESQHDDPDDPSPATPPEEVTPEADTSPPGDEASDVLESETSPEPIVDPNLDSTSPSAEQTTDPPTDFIGQASLNMIWRYAYVDLPSPQLLDYLPPRPQAPSLEHTPIGDRIRAFTVKVWGENSWGSGVIVQKQPTPEGWDYLVVTNSHVIRDDSVNIQTSDRQAHSTVILLDDRDSGYDLALLRFSSSQEYDAASVQTEVNANEMTIAVGFPFAHADLEQPENSKFHWTQGKVVHVLDESLVDGYQLAYSNPIEKGMSGGPVLNQHGELIAINGLHAYPLWGNPFVYPDGRSLDRDQVTAPEESSWSIPIAIVLERGADFWVNQITSSTENTVILRNHEDTAMGMTP